MLSLYTRTRTHRLQIQATNLRRLVIYEAEYYSAADATKEGLHLRQLMGGVFNAPSIDTTTIWEGNQSAIAYSQNTQVSEKTKHIGLKWHFLNDHVEHGTLMDLS
jgi:hypothetical protein